MFNIGPGEILLILVLALIVFGPRRLPEIGRAIGRSIREFRRASEEIRQEFRVDLDLEERPRFSKDAGPPATTTTGDPHVESAPSDEGRGRGGQSAGGDGSKP